MRGRKSGQDSMLALVSLNELIPARHPVRTVKKLADECLTELSGTFDEMYARVGRPSIPPERLLKAQLLMALYSVRSERMLCERIQYDMLFRWFLDMSMTEEVFDASSFSRNRDRLLEHEVAHRFLQAVVNRARKAALMSSEHFSVDGTLIEAWASMKSFRPKDEKDDDRGDGNGWGDFKGQKRNNETHESKTDPEAKLLRKSAGKEAKLCFAEHVLMENRNGLIVDMLVAPAVGVTEPEAALELLTRALPTGRITVGADKGYDTKDFVRECRAMEMTAHVAQHINARRGSAVDARITRHPGYSASQVVRRRIESIFGWKKTVGGCRKSRYRGVERTGFFATMAGAAFNLLRMARLLTPA
ncbi:MAG: IS5 family transposase [Myxococcota bacterium]